MNDQLPPDIHELVARRVSLEVAAQQFRNLTMESKRDNKGSGEKLVEAFIRKNASNGDLSRVDSGTKRGGGSPDTPSDSENLSTKNPKKLRVFEGVLSDDLPPLNSKIVRIFTSSTFTGL